MKSFKNFQKFCFNQIELTKAERNPDTMLSRFEEELVTR